MRTTEPEVKVGRADGIDDLSGSAMEEKVFIQIVSPILLKHAILLAADINRFRYYRQMMSDANVQHTSYV